MLPHRASLPRLVHAQHALPPPVVGAPPRPLPASPALQAAWLDTNKEWVALAYLLLAVYRFYFILGPIPVIVLLAVGLLSSLTTGPLFISTPLRNWLLLLLTVLVILYCCCFGDRCCEPRARSSGTLVDGTGVLKVPSPKDCGASS